MSTAPAAGGGGAGTPPALAPNTPAEFDDWWDIRCVIMFVFRVALVGLSSNLVDGDAIS